MLVYLIGFYNLDTAAGLQQFVKGFIKFVIHFTFLALAVVMALAPGHRLLLAVAHAGSPPALP